MLGSLSNILHTVHAQVHMHVHVCVLTLLAKQYSIPPCVHTCTCKYTAGDASAASNLDEKVIDE